MRTKEIEVWVNPETVYQGGFNVFSHAYKGRITDDMVRARLIIELPEKKVEITESVFHQMARDFEDPKKTSAFRYWYVKLFGEGREA